MASTSWKQLGSPITNPTLEIRVVYSSMSRTNNTVTINGVKAQMRVNQSGYFDGYPWRADVTVGRDGGSSNTVFSNRQVKDSTTAYYNVVYESSTSNKSFSVLSSSTSGWLDANAERQCCPYPSWSGNGHVSAWDLDIPDAGSPVLNTQSNSEHSTSPLTARTFTWTSSPGTNCTFTSMKIQYGLTTSYGSEKTGLSEDGSTSITGLTPGTTYNYRYVMVNGAGKTTNSSNYTFTLDPVPSTSLALLQILGIK